MSSLEFFESLPKYNGLTAVKARGQCYNLCVGDEVVGQAKVLRDEHCWGVVIRDYDNEMRFAWRVSKSNPTFDRTAEGFLSTAKHSKYKVSSKRETAVTNQKGNPVTRLDWALIQ